MKTEEHAEQHVWHAVIRDNDGVIRCMDPGCPFNHRRPGPDGKRDMRYHRATDLLPANTRPLRKDGPDRRKRSETQEPVKP